MRHRRPTKHSVLVIVAAATAALGASAHAAPPTFILIPKVFNVPGDGVEPAARINVSAISADGSTLTGVIRTINSSQGSRAYYYQINQPNAIPFVLNDPNYGAITFGAGISAEGTKIFGNGGPPEHVEGNVDADVWDLNGNATVLGFPDGAIDAEAVGASPDGTVIAGSTGTNTATGFAGGPTIWINNQPHVLTGPGGTVLQGTAYAVSNDASSVDFSNGGDSTHPVQYYRWTASGVTSIPDPLKSQPIWADYLTIHTPELGDQNLDDFLLNHGFPLNPQGTAGQPDYVPGIALTFGATAFAVHDGRIIIAGGDYGEQDDAFLATLDVPAAPTEWNKHTGGNWGDSPNWTQDVPTGDGAYATLGNNITGPAVVTLGQDRTIGHLLLNSSNSYTLNGRELFTCKARSRRESVTWPAVTRSTLQSSSRPILLVRKEPLPPSISRSPAVPTP